ncbi:MAG: hypothetical protein AABY22_20230 [Nanoarchaeota archaeon]
MAIKFLKRETQVLKKLERTARVLRKGLNDFIEFRLKQNSRINVMEQRINNIEEKLQDILQIRISQLNRYEIIKNEQSS